MRACAGASGGARGGRPPLARDVLRRTGMRLLLVFACLSTACASADDHAGGVAGTVQASEPIVDRCGAGPELDCPCTEVGATAECQSKRTVNGYTSCEPGKRTCLPEGRWGECVGASVWSGG